MEQKITLKIPTYQVGNNIVCLENEVAHVVNALMEENTKLLNLLEKATKEVVELRKVKPKLEEEYKNKLNSHKKRMYDLYVKKRDKLIEDYKNRSKRFNDAINENKLYRKYYGDIVSAQEILYELYKQGTCKKYDVLNNFSDIKVFNSLKYKYSGLIWKKILKDLGVYRKIGNKNIAYLDYKEAIDILDNLKIENEEEYFIKNFMKGGDDNEI
jgi:aspartyl/asparaginyl-tRNA synthetase